MLPIDVFIRKTGSLDDPPVGVSTDASSEFLTAKPTPCCLGSPSDRPFQKKV